MSPIVRFDHVTKRFGALTVLDDLCLDVSANEKVAIIGPSGSGKTTVLRTLMTLEPIQGGSLGRGCAFTHMCRAWQMVPGNEAHLRQLRASVGMVFQQFNLFPHMTAQENCMEAPVQVLGLTKIEARKRAGELLEMVGLAETKITIPPSFRADSNSA